MKTSSIYNQVNYTSGQNSQQIIFQRGLLTPFLLVTLQGSGKDPLVEQEERLEGSAISQARFGMSISIIGDLDLDGYGDVAIGAPNEEDGVVRSLYV